MEPVDGVFDTNILVDHLNGIAKALTAIASCTNPAISIITWIEVLAGTNSKDDAATRIFLNCFVVIPLTGEISERTVRIRQALRLKLPDAIIFATAQVSGSKLITRNTRDFKAGAPGIEIPYSI